MSGSWVKDVREGHGVYTYPNGDIYEGEWLNHMRYSPSLNIDRRQSAVKWQLFVLEIWKTASWYFIIRHGQGVYHYHATGSKYKGSWMNGKMEHAGEYIHSNYKYKGNYSNNNVSS